MRRDELVGAIWPESPPVSPESALNTLVSRLRKGLGEGVICGRSELTLELPADGSVDVESAFEEIQRAERALERSDWQEAGSAAELTLSVAERGFLPGVEAAWVDEERRRLEEHRLRALECLAACGLGLGGSRLSATERAAQTLIAAAPYRETGYRYLMQALAERGRVAEALRVFDEFRRLLQEELGAPPGAGLRSLHQRLLSQQGVAPQTEREDPLAVGSATVTLLATDIVDGADPDRADELRRAHTREPAAQSPFPLPHALSGRERDVFVGRESDFDRLWPLFEQASAGAHQIVLLRGEPGIGKTRLASELGRRAQGEGAVVLYGRCDEDPLLPHQPFVEALRHYVAECPLPELAGQVGQSGGELRRLVPELARRLPDLAEPLAGDPDGERYRLFEAVSALLSEAAQARPVVLVLDDLHWADKPTLLLLRHLARYLREAPLLVLGTYRETEVEPGHPLSETLADLSREQSFERHPLGPLEEAAVANLVSSHAGHEEPEVTRMIFEETEGNPFFVVEMLRHLAESGAARGEHAQRSSTLTPAEVGIPEGVKDVVGRRIARLGRRTHGVLSVASVSGRDFELAVLEHMSDLEEAQLLEALEQAVRAGVIEEVAGAVGRYTFSHALIRETLYGELSAARRALLHRRVGAALEQARGGDLEPHRAELAHHFAQAGSSGDVDKAIEYGARAGDRAVAQLAYEQAAAHYRQAVSLIGRSICRKVVLAAGGRAGVVKMGEDRRVA